MIFNVIPLTLSCIAKKIPTRWKFVVAGLIGSGTGLLFLAMLSPSSKDDLTLELNPQVQDFARTGNSVSQGMTKTTSGCKIAGCKTVTCSAITESENPGRFASDFITRMLPVECPRMNVIEQLEFQSCTFPNKKLEPHWLTIKWPIERLSLVNCGLEDLAEASFSSSIYSGLRSLSITRAKVKYLKKWIFEELSNLEQFLLTDNPIEAAEMNLLSGVANSLEDLGLEGSLKDIEVLDNITGRVTLKKLKNLYLRRNFLRSINSQTFGSLPNVLAIHLKGSSILELHPETFKLTSYLESLDLSENSLTTLPLGIFTSIISKNQNFQLSMSHNLWDCVCDFQWIIELIKTSIILTETPKCSTPQRNAFLYFTAAEFCGSSIPELETTLRTTTTSSGNSGDAGGIEKYVKFTCQNEQSVRVAKRKLLATEEWKFPSRHQDFSLRYLSNGHVEINFKLIDGQGVSIIWFENMARSTDSETIDCLTNLQESPVLLDNLALNSTYTICLLENLEESPSPLNCLAARTSPMSSGTSSSSSAAGTAAVWLTNKDKSVVISVAITLFLIVSLLSAISSLFFIRRNPSLLRGTKRIVMVKKHGVDALVMPKGRSFPVPGAREKIVADRSSQKRSESNYLSPLKTQISMLDRSKNSIANYYPRRKDSKVSRVSSLYSTGSYVSGIEATPSELYNWRNTLRAKNLNGTCIEDEEFYGIPDTREPPPLPYRALNPLVPSLSLAVDSDDRSDMFVQF